MLRVGGVAEVSKSTSVENGSVTQQSIAHFPPEAVARAAIRGERSVEYCCRRSHDFIPGFQVYSAMCQFEFRFLSIACGSPNLTSVQKDLLFLVL
jgi:hypothetical protein